MKKVLFVLKMPDSGSYMGGVASMIRHYMEHAQQFAGYGYEVEIFNYTPPAWVKRLPSKVRNIFYGLLQRRALVRKIRQEDHPIVHIHTSREFLFLKDLVLARHIHRRCRSRVVMTVHVGTADTVFHRIGFAKEWCLRTARRHVAKLLLLSKEMERDFTRLGIPEARCEVVYNFHSLHPLTVEQKPHKGLRLLFVGAIHREKGILELLRALKKLSDAEITLDICGQMTDSRIRDEFEESIRALGDSVRLHGYVTGEEKAAIFSTADILVLPSYHEGFPLVILEGLVSGCALISTAVGTTPEILSEQNVSWVGIGSDTDIAAAVKKYKDNPLLLAKTQRENLELSKDFTIERNIAQTCGIYDALAAEVPN